MRKQHAHVLLLIGIWIGWSGWIQSAEANQLRYPINGSSTVSAYYNHSTSGTKIDWNCGTKTYWSDHAHHGTDFAATKGTPIVAATAGTILYTEDGHPDNCTTGDCGGYGNYVKMQHPDGRVTYYGHMKTGSVAVSIGQTVSCGQKLGEVASSGNSTGNHLHFELRPNSSATYSNAIDPFAGSCSPTSPSLWVSQGSYLGLPSAECEGCGPNLCGSLDGCGTLAAGTYTLTCDIYVNSGASLHIMPGVTLNYNGYSFTVNGQLIWGP